MSTISKTAGAAILAGLLAGCASSNGGGLQANAAPSSLEGVFGAEDIADGKAALSQGNISLAIAAFRLAAVNPQTAGEANNGLGIAYARLGYTELAEAHFAKAITLTPTDTRFSSNLARLYRSEAGANLLARRQAEAEHRFAKVRAAETQDALLAAAPDEIVPERRGPLTIETARSRMARSETKEVFVTTGRESGPDSGTQSASQPAAAKPAKASPSRVTYLRDLPTSGQNSRVTTISTLPVAAQRPANVAVKQTYPIRVRLSTRVEN